MCFFNKPRVSELIPFTQVTSCLYLLPFLTEANTSIHRYGNSELQNCRNFSLCLWGKKQRDTMGYFSNSSQMLVSCISIIFSVLSISIKSFLIFLFLNIIHLSILHLFNLSPIYNLFIFSPMTTIFKLPITELIRAYTL